MYKFEHHMPTYTIPLKQELPCLEYDIAVYCDCLKSVISLPFPKYLSNYSECVNYHAKRIKTLKPKVFPDSYRVYIVDYRLNILFATLDLNGKIATYFSKYGKFGHDIEDYYYGDGEYIGDVTLSNFQHNNQQIKIFSSKYGFLPIEEFSMAAALVYDGAELVERRSLSQFQTILLMEKYKSKNLVDWKAIVSGVKNDFDYLN